MNRRLFSKPPKLMYAGLTPTRGGWLSRSHAHAFSEVLFVREGSGIIEAGEGSYPLKKGDLAVIDGGLKHREFFEGESDNALIFFAVDKLSLPGGEENSLLKGSDFRIVSSGDCYGLVDAALSRLIYETEAGLPFSADIEESLLELVLKLLLRLTAFDSEQLKMRSRAYREAKKYFDENFTNMDSLSEVCKNLYINRYYLTHIFKEEEGLPPVKYLILKRMEKAVDLLTQTDMDVGDVAAACGYVDPAYFCRVFKKTENCTPLQYRFRFKQQRDAAKSRRV